MEEDFDGSTAFESDRGAIIIIVLFVLVIIAFVAVFGWVGYQKYMDYKNQTPNLNQSGNGTNYTVTTSPENPGEVTINFNNETNVTVETNPEGIYYYTTQERLIGEKCYIDGHRKDCRALTNEVCAEKVCQKEIETVTECFVNHEKIDCPESEV
jgi:hypothetical protein